MKRMRWRAATQRAKFSFRRMDSMALVFWKDVKDVRGWETDIDPVPGVVNVFFPRYFKYRPTFGTDSYYFSGSEAFRNEIRFQTELNATAAKWNSLFGFRNYQ